VLLENVRPGACLGMRALDLQRGGLYGSDGRHVGLVCPGGEGCVLVLALHPSYAEPLTQDSSHRWFSPVFVVVEATGALGWVHREDVAAMSPIVDVVKPRRRRRVQRPA
jgi:hypothetical protein